MEQFQPMGPIIIGKNGLVLMVWMVSLVDSTPTIKWVLLKMEVYTKLQAEGFLDLESKMKKVTGLLLFAKTLKTRMFFMLDIYL